MSDETINVAAEKGFALAAKHNGGLTEKQQRALGVMFAPGGSIVARGGSGGHGTPMDAGLAFGEVPSYDGGNRSIAGTSIFDPTLTYAMYSWFGLKGGNILDPFAGGGVRGIVATLSGFNYDGIELRPKQIEENEINARELQRYARHMLGIEMPMPRWIAGDSSNLEQILAETVDVLPPDSDEIVAPRKLYDLLIACPPYYDLEIYSCSNDDGSSKQTYAEFLDWYEKIFQQAIGRLNWNRFAVMITGDVRKHDDLGGYERLHMDTDRIFQKLGCELYNQAILETAVGSLPVRVGNQFPKYRKLGVTHQHVQTFWYGDKDKRAIVAALGELSASMYAQVEDKETT